MDVLVLCDDRWHPASVVRSGLSQLVTRGFDFMFVEDTLAWSPDMLVHFPAVILSKSNNISSTNHAEWMIPGVEQAFVDYVRQGGGLLALHSGTAGYQETRRLRSLLGGIFVQHPEQCPVTVKPFADHPLTDGVTAFTLPDEHYHMSIEDCQADIFMTTESQHGSQPGGWRRAEELGRVCVLTPGHNLPVWQHPAYQILLTNTLRWVGHAIEEEHNG